MMRPGPARAVVPHYDHNQSICTNQRPPRDCRGPGAFFNPLARASSAAGDAGYGHHDRSTDAGPGDGGCTDRPRHERHGYARQQRDDPSLEEYGKDKYSKDHNDADPSRGRQAGRNACSHREHDDYYRSACRSRAGGSSRTASRGLDDYDNGYDPIGRHAGRRHERRCGQQECRRSQSEERE